MERMHFISSLTHSVSRQPSQGSLFRKTTCPCPYGYQEPSLSRGKDACALDAGGNGHMHCPSVITKVKAAPLHDFNAFLYSNWPQATVPLCQALTNRSAKKCSSALPNTTGHTSKSAMSWCTTCANRSSGQILTGILDPGQTAIHSLPSPFVCCSIEDFALSWRGLGIGMWKVALPLIPDCASRRSKSSASCGSWARNPLSDRLLGGGKT